MFCEYIQFGFIYTYGSELFSTAVRTFGISLAMTIACTVAGISTYIIRLMQNLGLNPMSFVLVIGLLSLVSSILLPETKNLKMKN